jgi:hypothetical protein
MAGASSQVVLVWPFGQVTWRRSTSMVKSSRVKPLCSFFCHTPLSLTGPTSRIW